MAVFYQNEMGTVVNLDLVQAFYVTEKAPFHVMTDMLDGTGVQMTTDTKDMRGSFMKLMTIMSRIQHAFQCPVYMDPVHDPQQMNMRP